MLTGQQAMDFCIFEHETNTATLAELVVDAVVGRHKISPLSEDVFETRLLTTARKLNEDRSSLSWRRTLLAEKRQPLAALCEARQLKRRKTNTECNLFKIYLRNIFYISFLLGQLTLHVVVIVSLDT